MGDVSNEPSMEDILASIKRIIAEDGANALATPRVRRSPPPLAAVIDVPRDVDDDAEENVVEAVIAEEDILDLDQPDESEKEVLELTQPVEAAGGHQPESLISLVQEADLAEAKPTPRLVSENAENASRSALASLSALIVKPDENGDNTLDGLVREMLRPMLKEWLDSRLPDLVESLVEKEIARITGRTF